MTGHVYVTAESAKELLTRLQDLGIAAKITVDADGRFKVAPADGQAYLPLARLRHACASTDVGLQGSLVHAARSVAGSYLGHLPARAGNHKVSQPGVHRGCAS